jgi:ech hydrogenase subunit C
VAGGIDKIIPVDVYIPGCAARPESIIDGIVTALGILEGKRNAPLSATTEQQPVELQQGGGAQ